MPPSGKSGLLRPRVRLAVAAVAAALSVLVAVVSVTVALADQTELPDGRHQPVLTGPRWSGQRPAPNRSPVPTVTPQPSPTVEADSLAVDGVSCASSSDRPILNKTRPVIGARTTPSAPVAFEIEKETGTGPPNSGASDEADADGFVRLYLRGHLRLEPGESYRWRVGISRANEWSPWCEFAVAAATLDSLNLDVGRGYTAGLPPSRWRDIAAVLGPGWPHGDTPLLWAVQSAGGQVSAGNVPVSLSGWFWETMMESLAEWASARNDPEVWRLVDALSVQLGGPPHPTIGFPRA